MNGDIKTLRLVIPAWRETDRLDAFAARLLPALAEGGFPVTLQIVDDGSPAELADALEARCAHWRERHTFVRPLLRLPENRGKGGAVYAGWDQALAEGAADADLLGFCDADGSVDAEEIIRLARLAFAMPSAPPHVVLASRHVPGAQACWSSPPRRVLSRLFVAWVRWRTGLALRDTQCGAKFLPAALYARIRPALRVHRFAFDVELLSTAQQAGARLREEPVKWRHHPSGGLRLLRDGWAAARDVHRLGHASG